MGERLSSLGQGAFHAADGENDFLPRLDEIPPEVVAKTNTIWIGYPHNPTGAIAPLSFFDEVVGFAKQHDIIVVHDNAYGEICYDLLPQFSGR